MITKLSIVMRKIKGLPKKYILIGIIAVILIVVGTFTILKSKQDLGYNFVEARKGTLSQEVSVSGKLKPSQSLDLGFEIGGRVSRILKKVGDQVFAGERIIELDASQLLSQLAQAEANLAAEQSRFEELKKGTRPEELQAARTTVMGLEKSLTEVKANQQAVKDKAAADLNNAYSDILASLQRSVSYAKTSLFTLTDIQYSHFYSDSNIADAKGKAILSLLGAEDAGRWTSSSISDLSGGAFGQVQKAVLSKIQNDIDIAILETEIALQNVKNALDLIPINNELTATEKTNLNTEKSSILTEISIIAGKDQAILVQKSTNAYNLAVSQASVTSAQNSYDSALDQLNLKEAGATLEQILTEEAMVEAVQAAAQNIRTQLAKTVIFSPINSILTKMEIEIGENVSPNIVIISLMSMSEFEIEARVAEVDIAKIKINDPAKVTLDAYGSDVIFEAMVVKIDPAETIIEGLPTYKVTLQFIDKDDRLKSGMTADIDILTAQKQEVILIPQRAVISKNGDKLVRVLRKGNKIEEVQVKTGLRGSSGEIEITEGLSEGDRVIISIKEK